MNGRWSNDEKAINSSQKTSAVPLKRLFVQFVVMVATGFVFLYLEKKTLATVIFTMAFIMTMLGVVAPSVFSAVEQVSKKAGVWIGEKITWVVLAVVYFIFFVPGRLILLLLHKDILERQFPGKETSYWRDCQKIRDPAKYQKQY
jgi:uncharacterized membrane protein